MNMGMDAGLLFHVIQFAIIWLIQFMGYKFFKSIDLHHKTLDETLSLYFCFCDKATTLKEKSSAGR
ncbi:MAG: hypothetical protein RR304_04170 [Bacteroides sp.]